MSSSPGPATRPADGAVVGAAVRTLDDERPSATALAWRDGGLVAVATTASTAALDAYCARSPVRVDRELEAA
jgi:predicted amidohydrolase YtcJ